MYNFLINITSIISLVNITLQLSNKDRFILNITTTIFKYNFLLNIVLYKM